MYRFICRQIKKAKLTSTCLFSHTHTHTYIYIYIYVVFYEKYVWYNSITVEQPFRLNSAKHYIIACVFLRRTQTYNTHRATSTYQKPKYRFSVSISVEFNKSKKETKKKRRISLAK